MDPTTAEVIGQVQQNAATIEQTAAQVAEITKILGPMTTLTDQEGGGVVSPADLTQEKYREDTRFQRVLSNLPKVFKPDEFQGWVLDFENVRATTFFVSDDQRKAAMMSSIRGLAAERVTHLRVGSQIYKDSTFEELQKHVWNVFFPLSERRLARREWKSYKQGANQDVAGYVAHKHNLYILGHQGQMDFEDYKSELIAGLYSNMIKRKVLDKNAETSQDLQKSIFDAVSAAREAYEGGYSTETSLDGLTFQNQTSMTRANAGKGRNGRSEPMEIDSIRQQPRTSAAKCFRCNRPGHVKKDCRVKLSQQKTTSSSQGASGSSGNLRPQGQGNWTARSSTPTKRDAQGNPAAKKESKKCFKCNTPGHYARDCRNKSRVRQLQDDEEYDEEIQIYRYGDVDSLQEELEDELIFLE